MLTEQRGRYSNLGSKKYHDIHREALIRNKGEPRIKLKKPRWWGRRKRRERGKKYIEILRLMELMIYQAES